MKNALLIMLMILFSILITSNIYGNNDEIKQKLLNSHIMGSTSQGRKFIIAFPPNEKSTYSVDALEIYVTSAKNTTVTLKNEAIGLEMTKSVYALQTTTFSSLTGEIKWDWEVRQSEEVLAMGFTLESPDPVSVYVLNSKYISSEGYMAIPVSDWGRNYIHCAYYDFNEIRPWASGFIIIGGYDNTKVRIKLKGTGEEYAKTEGGRDIGDSWTIKLDEGEIYKVQGDGMTRGLFDMTGSSIDADKPIGLISYHERTMIPAFDVTNGRSHLAEMLPPVSAWGRKYASVEFDRGTNKGDFFRIVASEPNTHYTIRWYGIVGQHLIAQRNGVLEKAGDFKEFLEESAKWPHSLESIRGASVFEFDKPALVMQYSYSPGWDGNNEFDPFMIVLSPVEQYTKSSIFQTPDNDVFNENYLNIIAVGDTTDPTRAAMKSITLDDKKLWTLESAFPYNQIPGTDLFQATVPIQPGVHYLRGNTQFSGFVYGFSGFDAYGWPAATSIRKLDEIDTLPPVISYEGGCGEYTITASELRDGDSSDVPRQIDQGISDYPELLMDDVNKKYSYNFGSPKLPDNWSGWPPSYQPEEYRFTMNVTDKFADAFAVFAVIDRNGNIAIDSIRYEADSLMLDPEIVDFEEVRVGTTKQLDISLENFSDSTLEIRSVDIKYGDVFKISDGQTPPYFDMPPQSIHNITVDYKPLKQWTELSEGMDIDSLIVETECLRYAFAIVGKGIEPKIFASDFVADTICIGGRKCIADNSEGLLIRNPGTMDLVITGIESLPAGYVFPGPGVPKFPFTIEPGGEIYFKDICFEPEFRGDYVDTVFFLSDATGPKPYITLTGYGRDCSSVESNSTNNSGIDFEISPNPSSEIVTIRYGLLQPQEIAIDIYDSIGSRIIGINKEIAVEGYYEKTISTAGFAAGVYLIRLSTGNSSITKQLLIVR